MSVADIIRMEQVRLLHERMPGILTINLVVSVLLVSAVWLQTSNTAALYWLVAFESFVAARYFAHKFLLPPAFGQPITLKTERMYAVLAGLSGVAWGSCLFVFNPDTLIELLPIALTLLGLMGGSVAALSYVWFAYLAFIVPVALSLSASFFLMGGEITNILGGMVIFYLCACFYFGIGFHRVLRETLLLRHEKSDLLESLEKQKNLAEQANVSKSRFLAAASHDLRQPLHTLALFFDVLKETRSDGERKSLFPKIDLSLDALSNLFNALLDVSRLDAGVVEPDLRDFYLSDILNELVHGFDSELEKKQLFLRMRGCKNSPVRSDRLLLERILRNLIGNAISYTKRGGVLVSCRARGRTVLLQVWDTGMGIPEDKLSEIFVEFQQLNNPHRDREQGLGLGLAIVHRLCRLLNHRLEVRSRPGSGSVFSLSLPRGNAKLCGTGRPASPVAHCWDLNMQRILVIDDERHILDAMRALLTNWGCEVITAVSLQDAVEQLSEKGVKPALILSDLRLRNDETGVRAIEELRERYGKEIPGILITGDTAPEQIKLASQCGFDLLHKPVRPAQLRTAIYKNLVRRRD